MTQVGLRFDRACDRWRELYRAAAQQRTLQHRIIADASRSADEKNKAKRLRAEAEAQIELLTEAQNAVQSDFYSYRYFASEGFLPGYSFPRLPLSAYIPGTRQGKRRDEFLSRPRFLAISEFGPRAIIYHEGARYRINKVILPVENQEDGGDILTTSAKQCAACGYLHPILEGDGLDRLRALRELGSTPRSSLCSGCKTWPPSALTRSAPMRKNAYDWATRSRRACASLPTAGIPHTASPKSCWMALNWRR